MLENAVYSVITVEGCAAILWKDGKSPEMREKAATALAHHRAGSARAARDRRDHPRAGRAARTPITRRRRTSLQDALCRQLDELRRLQAGQARAPPAREVPADGPVRRSEPWLRPSSIEVAFKGNRKEFFLWEADEPPPLDAAVIVDADRGEDLGRVHAVGELAEQAQRRRAARAAATPRRRARRCALATPDDVRRADELRAQDEDARRKAMERVKANELVMKVSDAEWQWDRKKLTFYFTAEKRVDFRALVRELASMFRTRIELKQIGVRDEAKRLDGIGRCGRQYCSASWLPELRPVNLGVAKDQRLSLNPSQISGACGRLMCCLRYEHEFYVQSRKRFPKEGQDRSSRRAARRRSSPTTSSASASRCAASTARCASLPLAELRDGAERGRAIRCRRARRPRHGRTSADVDARRRSTTSATLTRTIERVVTREHRRADGPVGAVADRESTPATGDASRPSAPRSRTGDADAAAGAAVVAGGGAADVAATGRAARPPAGRRRLPPRRGTPDRTSS